jgi:GTP-binding protein
VVSLGEGRSFVVADLPGLIEGAAEGAGLGHRFLRHLERCRVLVHLIAADVDQDIVEAMNVIRGELDAYDPELAEKEQIVVLSKIDVLSAEERAALLAKLESAGVQTPMALSAVSGEGLKALLERLWHHLQSSFVTPVEEPEERS